MTFDPQYILGIWRAYWDTLNITLATIIVIASLSSSKRRYWIAMSCFSIIAINTCIDAVLPHIIGIEMANAFGPNRLSVLYYFIPLGVALIYVYAALSLYPFMSAVLGRKIITGIVLLLVFYNITSSFLYQLEWYRQSGAIVTGLGVTNGMIALFYLLLWFRVYDLRIATDEKSQQTSSAA